ncbi:alkaline phosphatase family protein [Vibrio nomapromontoriensis]|uniref:alkaline phosphatase family protein n=1 Tax=Vibrio nomapromontoriensis TaxID=2910246 RepID=UPI003D0F6664
MTINQTQAQPIAPLVAGPILRRVNPHEFSLWMASSVNPKRLVICLKQKNPRYFPVSYEQSYQVSSKLWIIQCHIPIELEPNASLSYDVYLDDIGNSVIDNNVLYSAHANIEFMVSTKADHVLHGSCRNPHHSSNDSLLTIDEQLDRQVEEQPDMLLLNGDQIYADHVAGPMLDAIHQVITLLDLPGESFSGSGDIADSQQLYLHPKQLYGREGLLPHTPSSSFWSKSTSKAIFSSKDCYNHLITFSEFIAMYLLVWSPELWKHININRLEQANFEVNGQPLSQRFQRQWEKEKHNLLKFVDGLPQVRRVLAHIPTYMIFDDHDITDDWNLTVGWEKAAYEHPFSRQIIGNGMLAYLLCQAWGNDPKIYHADWHDTLATLFVPNPTQSSLNTDTSNPAVFNCEALEKVSYQLFRYERWHFTTDSHPKVVVLDTRTRRWRSESNLNKPSGLMDWEALVEFQHELLNQESVIVVSAAPMFGVKFIETMQRLATIAGHPLVIDAENWMAHPGSANTLLSIFTHSKTPKNFVILSGDVHYSFVYDIALRYRETDSHIYQITCSGIKNEFPEPLLSLFATLDAWLYTPRSPLNWFTKRKRLKVFKRHPSPSACHHLVNRSGIGRLKLNKDGKPKEISVVHGDGSETHFPETASNAQAFSETKVVSKTK